MKARFFTIEALSNLHVGSGEINYGLIDNLIQRDPVTELPNINSSSLKGAVREYFTYLEKNGQNKDDNGNVMWTVSDIFGSNPKENDSSKRKQGSVRFFEAELLSIPVRSNRVPYEMVTSAEVLRSIKEKLEAFDCLKKEDAVLSSLNKTLKKIKKNEDYKNSLIAFEPLLGAPLRIVEHSELKRICSDEELPVISRNYLENGQSANLWYEQVLPKHSHLAFVCMGEGNDFETFCAELGRAQLQIGANATIGYGYCKLTDVLSLNLNENQNEEDK